MEKYVEKKTSLSKVPGVRRIAWPPIAKHAFSIWTYVMCVINGVSNSEAVMP